MKNHKYTRTHTYTQKKKQIKEIKLLESSQISAFPLKSVSIAAKSITG